MPVTAALVAQFPNHLRYLLTSDSSGGTVTITCAGTTTPDLITDTQAGPLKAIANAQVAGIGNINAGATLTQGQSRALWLSDNTVNVGGPTVPRALVRITPRAGLTVWLVDATATAGAPTIAAVASAIVGTAYLDIESPGSIGA